MDREGPPLESLLHRITETPADFLLEPRIGNAGQVQVEAVAGDLLRLLGGSPSTDALSRLSGSDAARDRNRLAVTLVLCWLLADDWFRSAGLDESAVLALLGAGAAELAAHTPAKKLIDDPERREELARFALARVGHRPAGETVHQAQDRLTGLSAAERTRVLKAARAAEERARAIREALARKAAEESADKWSRE